NAKEAGCLQLWTNGPAAILVPPFRDRIFFQFLLFVLFAATQFGDRVDFPWPIFVTVLAEGVDQRKKWIRIAHPCGGGNVFALGADFFHVERVRFGWLGDE